MSDVKRGSSSSKKEEDLVDVFIPIEKNDGAREVFVGVNGKTWIIKKGVHVMAPRCVDEVIKNSTAQTNEAILNSDRLQEDFLNNSRSRGFNI